MQIAGARPPPIIIQPFHQLEADHLCALNPPAVRGREQLWEDVCGAVLP